jgi:hypothetical protein
MGFFVDEGCVIADVEELKICFCTQAPSPLFWISNTDRSVCREIREVRPYPLKMVLHLSAACYNFSLKLYYYEIKNTFPAAAKLSSNHAKSRCQQ